MMDIVEKLKQVADTKDIDILAKHLVCYEAANEIERLRNLEANTLAALMGLAGAVEGGDDLSEPLARAQAAVAASTT
jgi:proline dehydrogenase